MADDFPPPLFLRRDNSLSRIFFRNFQFSQAALLAAAPSDNRLQPVSTIAPPVTNIKQLFKPQSELGRDTDGRTGQGKRDSSGGAGDKEPRRRCGVLTVKEFAGVKGQMAGNTQSSPSNALKCKKFIKKRSRLKKRWKRIERKLSVTRGNGRPVRFTLSVRLAVSCH